MKYVYATLVVCLLFSLCSCNSSDNQLKEVLVEALETTNGVRTGLNIKFSKFEVEDILVKDSIAIYQAKYDSEKKNKIADLDNKITSYQKNIVELESKSNRDIVDNILLSEQKGLLETTTKSLESLLDWKPDYLKKYEGRNESEVLAKMVIASFDFVTLKGNDREIIDGEFLLSADGTEVLELLVGSK